VHSALIYRIQSVGLIFAAAPLLVFFLTCQFNCQVTFDVTRNDSRSDGKFRAQVKSIDFAHFIPARLGNVLEDMAQLTHLTHRFVTPALVAPKASNLVSLNINTSTYDPLEVLIQKQ
jgi:hypothetical protein